MQLALDFGSYLTLPWREGIIQQKKIQFFTQIIKTTIFLH
jgi:hypothetical protein